MTIGKKGFGLTGIVIIIFSVITVSLAGYMGYNRITSNEKKQSATPQNKPASKNTTVAGNTFTDKEAGLSFSIPEGWKTETVDWGTAVKGRHGVLVTSPDFNPAASGTIGDYKGSRVTVEHIELDQTAATVPLSGQILDGTAETKGKYYDVQAVNIAGISGATFKWRYEGGAVLGNLFEKGSRQYQVSIEEDLDGPAFNDYLDEYQQIVDSLKLL